MQDSKVTAIEKSRPKILVAGATGTLGTKITQILIGQKKPVRVWFEIGQTINL